jgi:hypothetical protein
MKPLQYEEDFVMLINIVEIKNILEKKSFS